MTVGDIPQAKRAYDKIRSSGVSAERVVSVARVYCQQCALTRCKTKHIENWLRQCVWQAEEKGAYGGDKSNARAKQAPSEPEAPALRHQPWHHALNARFGDAVYRSWIKDLWLEGDIVYCPTRFVASYVAEHYGRAVTDAIGHSVSFIAEAPPQHAYADFDDGLSAGEKHDQNENQASA